MLEKEYSFLSHPFSAELKRRGCEEMIYIFSQPFVPSYFNTSLAMAKAESVLAS